MHRTGRLKKYERGDYGIEKLKGYVTDVAPKILAALEEVCRCRGSSLRGAAFGNRAKIESRLQKNLIKGDGSNRENQNQNQAQQQLQQAGKA